MVKSSRPTPAYRQVADALRRSIFEAGGAGTGRLPTEAELSKRYGLSRQTVRRAYQDLVSEGMVDRVPGRGTFAVPTGSYMRSFGSLEDLLAQSQDTEMELISPLQVARAPEEEVRAQLRTERVMEMTIRRLHQGVPFAVALVSMPLQVGKRLGRPEALTRTGERRRLTVFELLDKVLDPPIVVAKQVITVAALPAAVAPLIDCSPGQHVMRLDRIFLDRDAMPIELAINYFNPDRYSYRLELRRTNTGPSMPHSGTAAPVSSSEMRVGATPRTRRANPGGGPGSTRAALPRGGPFAPPALT